MTDGFEDARRDARIADTVSFRLLVATNRMTRPFHDLYGRRFGIGLTDWRCLMALASAPGSSGEDVAEAMGLDRMTVSRTLRRQERAGRCAGAPDPANRRRNRWRLTDAGWAVVDAVMPDALARDAALFGDLTVEERAVLDRVLDRLG